MIQILITLFAVATVTAAPPLPAIPVVKRKAPLHSPSHQPTKDTPMFRVASVGDPSQPPLLPMDGSVVRVTNDFGTAEFTANALQPANNSILFEVAATPLGDWQPLAYFGPQPADQRSFASLYSYSSTLYIRAHVAPVTGTTMRQTGWMPASLVPAAGGNYYINPEFKAKGARAWSVKK